ncbi:MAG: HPr-rel-A system PqqD family peptide chaperone [Rhodocyclaceae bacterium]|nr:HPr-rel-A system PqqD family peptide chaperone [Rhodocyclaceae bacterium]
MPDTTRFDFVPWETGSAVYDRQSGATHLLDELATLLVEHNLSDPATAIDFLRSRYAADDIDPLLPQLEEGIASLKAVGLL